MNKIVFFVIVAILVPFSVYGKDIFLDEKNPVMLEISMTDLNLLKFSVSGIKLYTASNNVQFQIEGKNCFVLYKGATPEAVSAFILVGDYSYPILLVPKKIPSTIYHMIINDYHPESVVETDVLLESSEYTTHLRDIIRGLYYRKPLYGYYAREVKKDTTRWKGTSQMLITQHRGSLYVGEIHLIRNLTNEVLLLSPNIFWMPSVLAVSILNKELKPDEVTEVFLVKKIESFKRNKQELDPYERIKHRN